ncbi:ATP-binding protein [Pasteurella multocida]|uniref:ATP-binding protein n=1 Tax=Pasteurella multocida TaxID=747 RepID=UPI0012EA57BD|nr:ATP-binding protein [Pasteurella multocida]NNH93278.1 AAA family ATPase [Pasteurella multocida]QGV29641.1 ATP-binding protein [Pasteurella multocida]
MDRIKNPFNPGAGSKPPALVGRDQIIEEATIQIKRANLGNSIRSQMLLGLRGVGKTVLLNHISAIAEENNHIITVIEANEEIDLVAVLQSEIQQLLKKLSVIENIKDKVHRALSVAKSFFSTFNLDVGGISIEIKPEFGTADSGLLESDLSQLFLVIGETAQAANRPWSIFIDEVQYLKSADLSALIVALHRCSQKNLPILFFGAGLPQVAAMSGDVKSYAERLFAYPFIGALPVEEAKTAIREPIIKLNERIEDDALDEIVKYTKGYPYFLQEWGAEIWNAGIEQIPITQQDVVQASQSVFYKLDHGFFNVRLDRLTNKEKDYVIAMANLGEGPYKSGDIATYLGKRNNELGNVRAKIIEKGMIYSPSYGELDFTVPLFDDFLRRKFPKNIPHHD